LLQDLRSAHRAFAGVGRESRPENLPGSAMVNPLADQVGTAYYLGMDG
jgi:hypothetical protein